MNDHNSREFILDEIRSIFAKQKIFLMTTVDWQGRPRSRYMSGRLLEDGSIVGATCAGSAKVEQIRENPWVSVSTFPEGGWGSPFFILEGRCSVHGDQDTKNKYWTDDFTSHFSGPSDPDFLVYHISPVRVTVSSKGTDKVHHLDDNFIRTF
ncbi:MAG: hypothetical protein CVV64_07500 [Candidatus Wallbacteria bacterium HGW-Wallbacteria-1]|jgi:general stress protein 26|uniref:Pyridoxamine 5'-phosphate oxidase N-terminal domain-containing protein n=1 Tax=Candidatus Wallbacteria bacterium HGW-Wallbacteria-1 TaxID=2013854 RepID=A0A2N1PQT8_9BACT|nr:MAG: hypothetical protein CVV64_07500 [Candidatus Wallbacteria bacterium HGW-Wallbacteria-1]